MTSQTYWRNLTHFGRFRVRGADAATLLHHLTTNNIKKLKIGEGCDAVLVSNKARVLDWLTVWREEDSYLVLTSPNRRAMFLPHARKFVLFRQDVQFEDVSDQSAAWGLFGADTRKVLSECGFSSVSDLQFNQLQPAQSGDLKLTPTRRLPGSGVLLLSETPSSLQQVVATSGNAVCGDEAYNALRIEAGIPVAGLELTEEINPWEANLDFAISLDKGCYNGQEVIARLHTYKKIKQRLMGLHLQKSLTMADVTASKVLLKHNGRDAGFLTSATHSERFGAIALGYVRGDYQEPGTQLIVAGPKEQTVTVADLPFSVSNE